ncbi:MAG: stage III sporulation protein AF [Eubacteriales bacterium]
MNFFTEWIRNIVFISITVTLMNMIIPKNMGKYVKVIAGFLVMLVIIKPVADFIHADITLDTLFAKHTSLINQEVGNYRAMDSEVLSKNQDDLTIDVFKEKFIGDIQNNLSTEIGYRVEVSMEINEDLYSNDFGKLNTVTVVILEKIEGNSITPIPKILILSEEEKEEEIDPKIVKKINNFFLNFYNLEKENISINKRNKTMGGEN